TWRQATLYLFRRGFWDDPQLSAASYWPRSTHEILMCSSCLPAVWLGQDNCFFGGAVSEALASEIYDWQSDTTTRVLHMSTILRRGTSEQHDSDISYVDREEDPRSIMNTYICLCATFTALAIDVPDLYLIMTRDTIYQTDVFRGTKAPQSVQTLIATTEPCDICILTTAIVLYQRCLTLDWSDKFDVGEPGDSALYALQKQEDIHLEGYSFEIENRWTLRDGNSPRN
ncbi:hypothetical protein IAQ61_003373, partial [Plenodomus lingam]|uniref:uncharacterized protein n=1 Tax=Leptosphaeria maculans TaxID=5022 RepID=UPI003319BD9E